MNILSLDAAAREIEIDGYGGLYTVLDNGRIFSRKGKGKFLKPIKSSGRAYLVVTLWLLGKSTTHRIHRLVAKHFLPGFFEEGCVRHIDGNRHNNRVENLVCGERAVSEDQKSRYGFHRRALSLSERNDIVSQLVLGKGVHEIAMDYGVHPTTIIDIDSGRSWGETFFKQRYNRLAAEYTLALKPISLNNIYKNRRGGRVKTAEYTSWLILALQELKQQKQPRIECSYSLYIRVGRGQSKADIDNLVKPIADVLVRLEATPDDRRMTGVNIAYEDRTNTLIKILVEAEQ